MKSILPALVLAFLLLVTSSCNESTTSNPETESPAFTTTKKGASESSTGTDTLGVNSQDNAEAQAGEPKEAVGTAGYVRPSKSQIISPVFPIERLLHAWVNDNNDPHAAFDISKDGFFVVDYDGDGNMPYLLKKDSLIIYYEEAPERYRIRKITKDSLVLAAKDYEIRYIRWRK